MRCLLLLALVVAASALAPVYTPANNRVPGRYIVVLEDGVSADSVIGRLPREAFSQVKRRFTSALNGFVLLADAEGMALKVLQSVAGVKYIEEDEIISVNGAITNPGSWGIDRIDQRDLPLDDSMTLNNYGAGVHIYVIDTGINPDHLDFNGRAFVGGDFIGGDGIDCHGHGTHCAGTAASTTYGVANEAFVYGLRTLDCRGSGYKSDSIAALDWVSSSGQRPAVASMSLGGSFSSAQNDAVANSRAEGVVVVVAAGNDDSNACNYSPASAQEAITVGSTDSSDVRSYFSNWGSCVDMFAPGSGITSLGHRTRVSTATMSGTSMATPHVSGLAAVYLSSGYSSEGTYDALINNASPGRISDVMGSPNLLGYAA